MTRQNAPIGTHKTAIYTSDGYNVVKYHQTPVVPWNDKEIILDSGGWMSYTTKTRMNQASAQFQLGFGVFQRNFEWFVILPGQPQENAIPFTDGMRIVRGPSNAS